MKKKVLILFTAILAIVSSIGVINASASQTQDTSTVKNHEKSYDSGQVVNDVVQPYAVPAFLAGGLVYDAAKKAATLGYDAHKNHSDGISPPKDYQELANQQGPWSV